MFSPGLTSLAFCGISEVPNTRGLSDAFTPPHGAKKADVFVLAGNAPLARLDIGKATSGCPQGPGSLLWAWERCLAFFYSQTPNHKEPHHV